MNRRSFLKNAALLGAASTGAAKLWPAEGPDHAILLASAGTTPTQQRTLAPRLLMNGMAALSQPLLEPSQLKHRLSLARTRTAAYPLDRMDFIMIDLERPDGVSRHATQCYGDLSGRLLDFLCCSEGVDGKNDQRLDALLERILKLRRPSGIIGRSPQVPEGTPMEDTCVARLTCGLLRYHELTGDTRALDAAVGMGERLWKVRDKWRQAMEVNQGRNNLGFLTEILAQLYAATRDPRWVEFAGMLRDHVGLCDQQCHAHGFLSMLVGLQQMALLTGDLSWTTKVEENRRLIIERHFATPDGCVPEVFPQSGRNEGCAIADWLTVNLNAGMLGAPDGYEKAERIFWNALSFNQCITGCLGHRPQTGNGYGVQGIEEAWWCCVHHAGLAMSTYARHAVTFRDNAVQVNLLLPGRFEVPLPGGQRATVKVTTDWPSRAEARIEAVGLPAGLSLKLRVPTGVRHPSIQEAHAAGRTLLTFRGELGHRIEQCHPGVMVTYGPLVLIPATGLSRPVSLPNQIENGVPAGYLPRTLNAGVPIIKLATPPDAEGYVKLPLCPADVPLPEWSYFDEGPGAPTWVEGSAVSVTLKFPDGTTSPARFTPMCYNTSAMILVDTPVVFRGVETL